MRLDSDRPKCSEGQQKRHVNHMFPIATAANYKPLPCRRRCLQPRPFDQMMAETVKSSKQLNKCE